MGDYLGSGEGFGLEGFRGGVEVVARSRCSEKKLPTYIRGMILLPADRLNEIPPILG